MIKVALNWKLWFFMIITAPQLLLAGPICQDLFARRKKIAIVGPTSGGATMPETVRGYLGMPYFIVPTGRNDKSHRRVLDESRFEGGFYYEGDLPALMAWLKKNNIDHVVHGNDGGVELVEKVNLVAHEYATRDWKLQTFENKNTHLYKDKGGINDYVRDNSDLNLSKAEKFRSGEFQLALEWLSEPGGVGLPSRSNPVYVKPNNGAASQGAFPVRSVKQLENAFKVIIGLDEANGHKAKVTEILVGEHIGDPKRYDQEYAINVVSLLGWHVVSDMFHYIKRPNGSTRKNTRIYLYDDLLPYAGRTPEEKERMIIMREYVLTFLKIVGKENGISHVEVIWTENGPVLVEFNGRAAGGSIVELTKMAIGISQVDLYVESIFAPERFIERAKAGYQYDVRGYSASIIQPMVVSPGYLNINKTNSWLNSSNYPALVKFSPYHKEGTYLRARTTSLDNSIGEIPILHRSKSEIDKIKQRIHEAEQNGDFLSSDRP